MGTSEESMARSHLFEFLDQPWYSEELRNLQTEAIQRTTGRAFETVAPLVRKTLERTGTSRVIDLGSGAGGPWPGLRSLVSEPDAAVEIVLTDLFPNLLRFERLREESGGQIDFVTEPVDARAVPSKLAGMRTMFTAFHHLRPDDAVALLRDARDAGAPVGVFDVGSARTDAKSLVQTLVFLAFAPITFPLMYWVLTPLLGRLSWQRVVFTYLVPLMPMVTAWDFMATAFRSYTVAEMKQMVASLEQEGYVWEVGETGTKQVPVSYIVGYPEAGQT
jgi:hypothetical protein